MDKATKIHIILSATFAVISILALWLQWSGLISGVVILAINLYLMAMLYEAVHRSKADRKIENGIMLVKPAYFFRFPSASGTGLLILFIVIAAISGFANLYIDSTGIAYVGPTMEMLNSGIEFKPNVPPISILVDRIEALYFSLVTMITLGYGDFIPVSTTARMLVVWQLATGGLMVIGIFPLIISRAADF